MRSNRHSGDGRRERATANSAQTVPHSLSHTLHELVNSMVFQRAAEWAYCWPGLCWLGLQISITIADSFNASAGRPDALRLLQGAAALAGARRGSQGSGSFLRYGKWFPIMQEMAEVSYNVGNDWLVSVDFCRGTGVWSDTRSTIRNTSPDPVFKRISYYVKYLILQCRKLRWNSIMLLGLGNVTPQN